VSTLSHELNEAITDPLDPQYAWGDKKGNELGDMCGSVYGKPLGSTNPSDPKSSEYNQVINGGKYYTQAEFSNLAYSKLGYGKGCALSEALAENPTAEGVGAQSPTVGQINNDATPWTLPADGKSTSSVALGVADPAGNNVVDDHVHFTTGVESGSGRCGTLSRSDVNTDDNGYATVTYTASTSNVACWVLAVEALGGRSAESVIYQGTTEKASPTFKAAFPSTLEAGSSSTFTIKATDHSSNPIPDTRTDFAIFPGSAKSPNVDASQIHLSYSTSGTNGPFTTVPLRGSTVKDGVIQGSVGPPQGSTIPPNSTTTYTFRIALAKTVPASKTAGPLLGLEAYLDQVNSASGSGATLADTYAHQVKVPTKASPSNTTRNVLIAVAALLALVAAGAFLWRRRRNPPEQTPIEPATP
jgi:MYXO-CTERM domain-containing protein